MKTMQKKDKIKKEREKIYFNKIRGILKDIEMSQQELCDLSGIDASHISKIILGKKRCISLPIALKICKALKKPVEEVFIIK
jgi:DNA-binding Xre family transcriptional regulator